jgi:hypothetical protein
MGKWRSLHISIEIGEHQVDGLVDGRASRSVISISTVKELGLMHLVMNFKCNKNVLK